MILALIGAIAVAGLGLYLFYGALVLLAAVQFSTDATMRTFFSGAGIVLACLAVWLLWMACYACPLKLSWVIA